MWYLRYSLSYRDLDEIMASAAFRGPCHDLASGPALCSRFESAHSARIPASQSILEVDETYVRVVGSLGLPLPGGRLRWRDYRLHVVAEAGSDCCKALLAACVSTNSGIRPRVINVDGHPAYARAIAELKQCGELGRRCCCRTSPYLNNIIEQEEAHYGEPGIPVGGSGMENG